MVAALFYHISVGKTAEEACNHRRTYLETIQSLLLGATSHKLSDEKVRAILMGVGLGFQRNSQQIFPEEVISDLTGVLQDHRDGMASLVQSRCFGPCQ